MKNEKLIKLRKEKRLTQQQLAKKLNVSVSTIGMMESGDRIGSIELLNKLADFFEVSLDYLTGVTANKETHDNEKKLEMVEDFLNNLVEEGIITDANNISDEICKTILDVVRAQTTLMIKRKDRK